MTRFKKANQITSDYKLFYDYIRVAIVIAILHRSNGSVLGVISQSWGNIF
jgi:hypothetical protein